MIVKDINRLIEIYLNKIPYDKLDEYYLLKVYFNQTINKIISGIKKIEFINYYLSH